MLNPRVSFAEKNGVCAIYLDFDFWFLWDEPAIWFKKIAESPTTTTLSNSDIPDDFMEFLKTNQILIKEMIQDV
ncbi:MAG: hypothetical protein ABIG90_00670 [bacterium]